jgi:hypothetical protein
MRLCPRCAARLPNKTRRCPVCKRSLPPVWLPNLRRPYRIWAYVLGVACGFLLCYGLDRLGIFPGDFPSQALFCFSLACGIALGGLSVSAVMLVESIRDWLTGRYVRCLRLLPRDSLAKTEIWSRQSNEAAGDRTNIVAPESDVFPDESEIKRPSHAEEAQG